MKNTFQKKSTAKTTTKRDRIIQLLIILLSTSITLAISEVALRVFLHIQPGFRYDARYFNQVKELRVLSAFIADSAGTQRVDPLAGKNISYRIRQLDESDHCDDRVDTESVEVYRLVDFYKEFTADNFSSDLKSYIQRPSFPNDDSDSAILYYIKNPINGDGFRSIPFKRYDSKKKKILMLGDSFTWGHGSTNWYRSFSDNLLGKGYIVYNSGITSTDPIQYRQIAEQYVPELQPDLVVMNVYLGNDIVYYTRQPQPYVPLFFCTNAGNLITCFNGYVATTPKLTYDVILDNIKIPKSNSLFSFLVQNTAAGTLAWKIIDKHCGAITNKRKYEWLWQYSYDHFRIPTPDVNHQIELTKSVCDKFGCRLLVIIIPSLNYDLKFSKVDDFPGLLKNIAWTPSPVSYDGFNQCYDGHFNDLGNIQYAEFIDSIMKKSWNSAISIPAK